MALTMLAQNGLKANAGECYAIIGNNRYNLMNCKNIEVTFEKNKTDFGILGRQNKAHKSTSSNITGSAEFYLNMSIWRTVAQQYQDSGQDLYFDMIIVNEDKTSQVGRQSILLRDCNFDSVTLAMLDADSDDVLTESMDFTAESFEILKAFDDMDGVGYTGTIDGH